MSFGAPEKKFEPISSDSYYERLFEKVRYYNPEIYKIFDIARILLDDKFGRFDQLDFLIKEKSKLKELRREEIDEIEVQSSNEADGVSQIDNMRSITEIPKILKKQFMLPDEIFDQKLIFQDLLVKRQVRNEKRYSWDSFVEAENQLSKEKYLRRQRSYILMDVSGSTDKKNRLILEKAIILNYLENNQKEKGEIFFRAFNHEPGPLYRTFQQSDYKYILNMAILPQKASGQTNIEKAIVRAIKDIKEFSIDEYAEILLITDGLSSIDMDKIRPIVGNIKINIILIGDDALLLSDKELSELFQDKHKFEIQYLKTANFSEDAKKKMAAFENLHKADKHKIQKELRAAFLSQLSQLATQTGGKLIEIEDLSVNEFNHKHMLEHIRDEMVHLQDLLKQDSLSPLERDKIIEQYLSLKNYLNTVFSKEKLSTEETQEVKRIRSEMTEFVQTNVDVIEMIKQSKLKFSIIDSNSGSTTEISLFDLFKIIFHKFKVAIFRQRDL